MYEDLSTITIVKLRDPKCSLQNKASAILADVRTLQLDLRYFNLIEHHLTRIVDLCTDLMKKDISVTVARRMGNLTISSVSECRYNDPKCVWKLITSLISTYSKLQSLAQAEVKINTTPHRMAETIDRSFSDMVRERRKIRMSDRLSLFGVTAPPQSPFNQ